MIQQQKNTNRGLCNSAYLFAHGGKFVVKTITKPVITVICNNTMIVVVCSEAHAGYKKRWNHDIISSEKIHKACKHGTYVLKSFHPMK